MIDWSATASWLMLAVVVIVPAITTFLNNRHSRKMRQMEIDFAMEQKRFDYSATKRAQVFNDYLQACSHVAEETKGINQFDIDGFIKAHHAAYIYASPKTRDAMDAFYAEAFGGRKTRKDSLSAVAVSLAENDLTNIL